MKVVSREELKTLSSFTVDGGKYAGMKLGDYFDDVEQEAYTGEEIQKAIDKVEEYICDVETDTVKAQGMAQALDIFEQALRGNEV